MTDRTTFPHFGTDAIHAAPDPSSGAVMTPITMCSTFAQSSPGAPFNPTANESFAYARAGNPTRNVFEANTAALEGGKYGIAFGSGMAAVSAVVHLLSANDRVVCTNDLYGGSNRYFTRVAKQSGNYDFCFVDTCSVESVAKAVTKNTKLVWIETPTNPLMRIVDIEVVQKVAEIAKAASPGVVVVCDNTFATPYGQRPLEMGVDVVMHSVTKYINGHSDVIMGLLVTNSEELNRRLRFIQNSMGAVPSPFDCFLALRGSKTLHVRMRQHEFNAFAIARFLEAHSKVQRVSYPGLPSHPQHSLAVEQMKCFGGMITFWIKGGENESRRFLENLTVFTLAESLGGVESLAEHPAIMTHASMPPQRRKEIGIDDNLVRLSVGIEETNDLLADLSKALDSA